MKQINIHLIRTDGDTQSRISLNQDIVNEYAEHLRDGDAFPPMVVFHDGSDYWLADGFHRLFALKANGASLVEVDVRAGTVEDAQLFSFSANGKRGLSNSAEDNRNIIIRMLKHPKWSLWGYSEISKHVGVSRMTVSRIAKTLDPNPDASSVKQYVNRHGTITKVDTAPVKQKPVIERPVGTKPDSSTIDEKQMQIAQLTDRVSELSDVINELSTENDNLKDKIAIGQWDASEFEKVDIEETVASLRRTITVLEIDNKSLREGRDMYQNRNAELMNMVKSLQNKIKSLEAKLEAR
jgi:FtsZ-binding cell division protein ZapB